VWTEILRGILKGSVLRKEWGYSRVKTISKRLYLDLDCEYGRRLAFP
jgi:hypothetical protein